MAQRLSLQTILETLIEAINANGKVYFQPPSGINMVYPCIVYKRNDISTLFADNNPYRQTKEYLVTVIDRNPDSLIPDAVAKLPMTTYDRFYVVENLNHDVFTLYF